MHICRIPVLFDSEFQIFTLQLNVEAEMFRNPRLSAVRFSQLEQILTEIMTLRSLC